MWLLGNLVLQFQPPHCPLVCIHSNQLWTNQPEVLALNWLQVRQLPLSHVVFQKLEYNLICTWTNYCTVLCQTVVAVLDKHVSFVYVLLSSILIFRLHRQPKHLLAFLLAELGTRYVDTRVQGRGGFANSLIRLLVQLFGAGPWVSPTLTRLHCACVCVYMYVLAAIYHNFK